MAALCGLLNLSLLTQLQARNHAGNGDAVVSGNFAGLIHTPGTNDSEKTGFARVESTGGAISGLVFWQGYRFGIAGPLDAGGQFKVTIRKANTRRGRFLVTFNAQAGNGTIGVTVDDQDTHANGLLLPAVQVTAGYFTAHFEVGNGGGKVPEANGQIPTGPNLGTGYATMRAKENGVLRLVGRLPDGKRFSAGTVVTSLGTFPFYSGQYMRVQRGSAYGDLTFPVEGVTYSPMFQHRPPSNGPLYPAGFDVVETFVCNRYILPPKGTPVLPFEQQLSPNGRFDLFGGNLPGTTFIDLFCDGRNAITFTSPNPLGVALIVYRRAGLFHGVFTTPGGARKVIAGSIVQGEDLAAGLFFGNSETGTAEFFPFDNPR
jgi:hypothetical protein